MARDSDSQDEIRLRAVAAPVVDRWWVIFLAIVLGALLGFALNVTRSLRFEGEAVVSIGQPLNSAGQPVVSAYSNFAQVRKIAVGQSALAAASRASDIPAEQLRANLSVTPVGGSATSATRTPSASVVSIVVQGRRKDPVTRAANTLAEELVEATAESGEIKAEQLEIQQQELEREIGSLRQRMAQSERRYDTLSNSGLDQVDAALASLGAAQVLTEQSGELRNAREKLIEVAHDLDLNRLVERSSVLTPAAAQRLSATSRSSAIVVGSLIGLLVGLALALLLGRRSS